MNEVEESAKAIGAVAETAGKGIDASRELGGFLAHIFGPALTEAGGVLHDWVKVHRYERLLIFRDRLIAKRKALGLEGDLRPVPLAFVAPLLEAAVLEDDSTLRDMFATLLANATAENGEAASRRTFVSILKDMEPFDAKVLLAAYNSPPANTRLYPLRTIYTAKLPDGVIVKGDPAFGGDDSKIILPAPHVELALWNLAKLGCVAPAGLWDGAASIGVVTVTALGIALIDASTSPEARTFRPPVKTA